MLLALSGAAAVALVFVTTAAGAQGVTITAPLANATVSNATTITAFCDGGGVRTISSVRYRIDDGSYIDMSGPNGSKAGMWTASWNSATVANGNHTILCRETLPNGTNVSSAIATVKVSNGTITISIPATSALAVTMDATATTPVVINVKSTLPWSMTVQADHALQVATRTIPAQRLAFTSSTDGASGFIVSVPRLFPVGSSTSVITSCAVTPIAGNNITTLYRLRVTDDDPPGVYSALHSYTVTGN